MPYKKCPLAFASQYLCQNLAYDIHIKTGSFYVFSEILQILFSLGSSPQQQEWWIFLQKVVKTHKTCSAYELVVVNYS